jgi:hypothetical protein
MMLRAPGDYDVFIDDFAEGESRVYGINWLNWLAGASLVGSTIEVETAGANLVATPTQDTLTVQRFRLSGGTAGERYSLVATVTTSTGDTLKASVLVVCRLP